MILETHHMVDDVAPHDQAMEDFREAFVMVGGCVVSEDGRTITFQFKSEENSTVWLTSAKKIIVACNLPLEATVDVWKVDGVVFSVTLLITYKPRL